MVVRTLYIVILLLCCAVVCEKKIVKYKFAKKVRGKEAVKVVAKPKPIIISLKNKTILSKQAHQDALNKELAQKLPFHDAIHLPANAGVWGRIQRVFTKKKMAIDRLEKAMGRVREARDMDDKEKSFHSGIPTISF